MQAESTSLYLYLILFNYYLSIFLFYCLIYISLSPYILLSYLSILLIVYILSPFHTYSLFLPVSHKYIIFYLPSLNNFTSSIPYFTCYYLYLIIPLFPYPYDNPHKSHSIPYYTYSSITFTFLLIIYHTNLSQTQQNQYVYRLILNIFIKCTIIIKIILAIYK
jgi:hypothetical protein